MTEPFRIGYTADFLTPEGTIGWGDIGLDRLEGLPNIDFSFLPQQESVLSVEQAADFDALVVLAPKVTAELLDNAPRLSVVARFGVGYDNVDLEAATRNGVAVAITPEGVRRAMGSTAMAFMLALSHRIVEKDQITRAGEWATKLDYMGVGMTGKTLGSIGLGNIARDMFHLAEPWDMRRIAYDPFIDPELAGRANVELVDLDTLMAESDYVVVLCNLTEETHHLINRARLAQMKSSAFLVSIARGPVVEEAALYEALRDKTIRGAAMDVFDPEPPSADNPIFKLDNVIVSPHALAWTSESGLGNGNGVLDAILDVREGKVPTYVVNKDVIDSPRFQEKLRSYKERMEQ
jgi:phosphoglycerate dehydrogenase-like enzyme